MKTAWVLLVGLFIASATLLVSSCGGGGGVNSSSSTQAASPKASLSASALSFGNQTVGTASAGQMVALTNGGNATLSILGISMIGASAGDFSQTNACGTSLAAGKSCNISVTFTPSTTGNRTASLAVTDNASGSPHMAALSGTGVAPPPVATLAPTSLDFGNETVGVTSTGKTVALTNSGQGTLNISSISVTGANSADFSQTNACGTSLDAGMTCNISITFTPSAAGARTASLTVTDDASGSPHMAALSGTGVAPPPVATLAPTSLDFGNETVGATSTGKTVTLTNSGQGTLNISSISVTGANAGDFSQTNVCGTSLAAGASCNIAVMFTPTTGGTRTASLAVTDNASGSPQLVPLAGTGIIPILSVSPTSATVLLGGTQAFALNTQATCTSTLFGNMLVSGSGTTYTATYTVPQALPSAWLDTFTCTATVGNSQASAPITLNYPLPVITGSGAPGGNLGTLWSLQPVVTYFSIYGNGFLSDLNLDVPDNYDSICAINQISWNEIQMSFVLSYVDFGGRCSATAPPSWNPGFISFTVSDPATGHGGGTSNVGGFAFLGDQNLLASNNADAFLLDPNTSTVRKFKIADGSPDGSFTFSPGTGLAIAVDEVTGDVVVFTGTSVEAFDPATNAKVYELDAGSGGSLHGGAAGGGWAVLSAYDGTEGIPDTLDAISLQQGSLPVHVSYKGTPQDAPWNFQIVDINNSPTEVVWSAVLGVLSTVDIATQQVISSITIPNVFVLNGSLSTQIFRGGWQLQAFSTGPLAGTAVLLSQYDQMLIYVDLKTDPMTEIRRVNLRTIFTNANPPTPELQAFRLAKDEADGSIAVAFADPMNGKTVLYNVDASGNMTPLTATAPFLATGLQESADGTLIYWGNRSSFAISPKQ